MPIGIPIGNVEHRGDTGILTDFGGFAHIGDLLGEVKPPLPVSVQEFPERAVLLGGSVMLGKLAPPHHLRAGLAPFRALPGLSRIRPVKSIIIALHA